MTKCCGNSKTKLIYSCSGVADVGEVADRAARTLVNEGFAKGSCNAAIGAGLSGYVQSARGADVNISVDGCPVGCVRKTLENIGVNPVSYVVSEMGFEKGETYISPGVIEAVCENIRNGKYE